MGPWIIFVIFATLITAGCSQETPTWKDRPQWDGLRDLNDSEREKRLDEMLEITTRVCENKSEGDSCEVPNLRNGIKGNITIGNMNATCLLRDNRLVCTGDRFRR